MVRVPGRQGAERPSLHGADLQALQQRGARRRPGSRVARPSPGRARVPLGVRPGEHGQDQPRRQSRSITTTAVGAASLRSRRRSPSGSTRRATLGHPRTSSSASCGGASVGRIGAIPSRRTRFNTAGTRRCNAPSTPSRARRVIFGMFGVRAEFNGDLRIDPTPPAFAPQMELNGLRLRGHVLDIRVDGRRYEVREEKRRIRQAVGQPTILPAR